MKNTLDNVLNRAVALATKRIEENSGRYTMEDRGVMEAINRYLENYRPFDGRWEDPVRNPKQTVTELTKGLLQAAKQVNRTHNAVMKLLAIDANHANRDIGNHAIDDGYYAARTNQWKTIISIRNIADTIAMQVYRQLY